MAKKKYYAVKVGIKTGIYETWAECEAQTKGVSGAQYKSFGSLTEAEKYMSGSDSESIHIGSSDIIKRDRSQYQIYYRLIF